MQYASGGAQFSFLEHGGTLYLGANALSFGSSIPAQYQKVYNAKRGSNPSNYKIYLDPSSGITFSSESDTPDSSVSQAFAWPADAMLNILKPSNV